LAWFFCPPLGLLHPVTFCGGADVSFSRQRLFSRLRAPGPYPFFSWPPHHFVSPPFVSVQVLPFSVFCLLGIPSPPKSFFFFPFPPPVFFLFFFPLFLIVPFGCLVWCPWFPLGYSVSKFSCSVFCGRPVFVGFPLLF